MNIENLKMIPCKVCKEPMPELRLTKFGYKSCVNCSTTSAYRAINTTNGTGDHTWNDIQIVTQEQYDQYQGQHDSNFDRIEESKEDNNLQGPLTIIKTD
tara:strand:+ start:12 stop:308 length:297 start_codon:yes stop_codon:yes gene_type:complete